MKRDPGDPLDSPAQQVRPEVRVSQGRPETPAQWVNQDTEDQTDLQGNQDLTENLELQVLQETRASPDQWGPEGFLVCRDFLDSRVIRAWQVCSAQRVKLELWDSRERLELRVRWVRPALRVQWECREREAEPAPADLWVNVVLKVMWANLVLWAP